MNQWRKVVAHVLRCLAIACVAFSAHARPAAALKLPPGVEQVATVEGVREYRLSNGFRFILFADGGKPTVTVNLTYLVGSRHENYGETGMAHLLEHMIFKGSKNFPDPTRGFKARGFEINGTTWFDRTNYYLTFPAKDDNLRWAIAWQADAMVNSFIARRDLDTEMSVVRNEFEMGESEPASVMFKRLQAMLFDWHNYGNSTIGARSDIEQVKIENLQAFYRKFYQPDNAVLVVAGKIDEQRTLDWIVASFGRIAKPARKLVAQWTREPTADGERQFVVRRKGEVQLATLAYRTPSSLHPDSDAIAMASEILGDTPNGRLYQALVQSGLATQVFAYPVETREPGFVVFGAVVNKGDSLERARERMIEVVEGGFARAATTAAELARVVEQSRTAYERALADPESFAVTLSEYIALGDWRLFFFAREQLGRITPVQVDAAAAKYFLRDNRVAGSFIPEDAPQRAVVPPAPSAAELLADFRPAQEVDAGEVFEPSPDNLNQRTLQRSFGDLRLALLPKRNRGQTVNVAMRFRWGSEETLRDRNLTGALAIAMLGRGTSRLTRQQIADALTRLKVRGNLTRFETTRDKLPEALRLVFELLHDASFPEAEFAQLKREYLTSLQAQIDSPEDLSRDVLGSHFNTYPRGDPRYHATLAERIEELKRTTIEDVIAYHRGLIGTARGEIAIVGDFSVTPVEDELRSLYAHYVSASPYTRVEREFRSVPPRRLVVDTADKENAVLRARLDLPLRDDDDDAPALHVANYIFGGSSALSNRLVDRLRQKEGISYSTDSQLSMGSRHSLSTWTFSAMVAPQNAAQAEKAFLEELLRARREGFTAEEVAEAKRGILESNAVARAQDSAVAARWLTYLDLGRNWQFAQDFERRVAALTPEQVSDAFRRHIDPEKMARVIAGDTRKGLSN